jgi:hypothetical protein
MFFRTLAFVESDFNLDASFPGFYQGAFAIGVLVKEYA